METIRLETTMLWKIENADSVAQEGNNVHAFQQESRGTGVQREGGPYELVEPGVTPQQAHHRRSFGFHVPVLGEHLATPTYGPPHGYPMQPPGYQGGPVYDDRGHPQPPHAQDKVSLKRLRSDESFQPAPPANCWKKCDIHFLVEKVVQASRLNPDDSHALSKLQCFTEESLPSLR